MEELILKLMPYQEIKDQLEIEKKNFVKNFYAIAGLVTQIYNDKLYEYWGFGSFRDFVSSSLDINLSSAYRMVTLVNGQAALNIDTQDLLEVKSTNLLEIFSLNPEKNANEIKTLLEDAKTDTIDSIKNKVRRIKGLEENVWRKYNLSPEAAEVVDAAIEKIKVDYGDSIDISTKEIKEISNSRALEMMAASYLAS